VGEDGALHSAMHTTSSGYDPKDLKDGRDAIIK